MIDYKYNCNNEAAIVHECDPCDNELARVRGVILIENTAQLSETPVATEVEALITAGAAYVIPETSGSYDGGTPKMGAGVGDESERLLGYDHVATFFDPTYAKNQEFWDGAAHKKFKMLFKTSSKLHYVKDVVRVTAKNEIADDIGAKVGWTIECKWFSANHPAILDLGDFEKYFLACFEIKSDEAES